MEERMLAELPYRVDEALMKKGIEAKRRTAAFNALDPADAAGQSKLLSEIFGKIGEGGTVFAPLHVDYGKNTEIGARFFANYNFVVLDVAKVTIGDDVFFGPNVSLITAGHPIHPTPRNARWEYGIGISIGNSVWLGANVVVNPGVTIGSNTVIGSGSVVTRDIPENVVAAGNPCRVLRAITEEDRNYYFKKRIFDVDI